MFPSPPLATPPSGKVVNEVGLPPGENWWIRPRLGYAARDAASWGGFVAPVCGLDPWSVALELLYAAGPMAAAADRRMQTPACQSERPPNSPKTARTTLEGARSYDIKTCFYTTTGLSESPFALCYRRRISNPRRRDRLRDARGGPGPRPRGPRAPKSIYQRVPGTAFFAGPASTTPRPLAPARFVKAIRRRGRATSDAKFYGAASTSESARRKSTRWHFSDQRLPHGERRHRADAAATPASARHIYAS